MELKSILKCYLAKRISVFALNLQSLWLILATFGNLCRFLKFDPVGKNFSEEFCATKIPQIFLNPGIYFD